MREGGKIPLSAPTGSRKQHETGKFPSSVVVMVKINANWRMREGKTGSQRRFAAESSVSPG